MIFGVEFFSTILLPVVSTAKAGTLLSSVVWLIKPCLLPWCSYEIQWGRPIFSLWAWMCRYKKYLSSPEFICVPSNAWKSRLCSLGDAAVFKDGRLWWNKNRYHPEQPLLSSHPLYCTFLNLTGTCAVVQFSSIISKTVWKCGNSKG